MALFLATSSLSLLLIGGMLLVHLRRGHAGLMGGGYGAGPMGHPGHDGDEHPSKLGEIDEAHPVGDASMATSAPFVQGMPSRRGGS